MSYAIQNRDGAELNRLYREDHAIHDWYRFVLSFPPHLVRDYIQKFKVNKKQCVLDPFCGTGTTLVECKKLGITSVGIEANPIVQFAANTKLNWNIDPSSLIDDAELIAKKANAKLKRHKGDLKNLTADQEKLIITNSISPLPLHKSLVLLEVMSKIDNQCFSDILRLAFAKQLVYAYSNLRFGPEVGVSRKKKDDACVVELWLEQVKKMASDIEFFSKLKNVKSKVHLGDSREIGSILEPESINAIITSPPYPNEKDYTRTTRLESVLLGYLSNKKDLRNSKDYLLRSNTRNVFKSDNDEEVVINNKNIMDLAERIENKRIELGKTSGFERLYHRVVKNYFGGMARHLEELKPALCPGAKLAYVVGDQASYFRIPIRTGQLLAELATSIGYDVIDIDLFRTRLSTATKEQLREEVVLLRWKG